MTDHHDMPLWRGIVARDKALEKVQQGANPDWYATAHRAALEVAHRQATFTTDDVWAALHGASVETPEPRAMGAVMRQLSRDRVVVNTYSHRLSSRPACHARPVTVWRSLVHRRGGQKLS